MLVNEHALKLAIHWQAGDWVKISEFQQAQLSDIDNKAEAALMVSVACLQVAENKKALQALQWAKQWGASKELQARYLIKGVYNTLALARLIDDASTAELLFCKANEVSENIKVLDELSQQNYLQQQTHFLKIIQHPASINKKAKEVKRLKTLNLGYAWAGNTINTVIFRHHAIFTAHNYQYTAFYVDTRTLRVVKRNLDNSSENNEIETFDIKSEYNLKDAHNSISLAMDRQGYLHLSYDHHGSTLHYRRSVKPYQIDEWCDELSMTGENEEKVTYPTFIMPHNNTPLLILYRDGNWKRGSAYLKYYDESLKSWFDYFTPILSGADQQPWTSNAYWNNPVMDQYGCLHLSYTWRTDYFSDEQLINNINIDYAKSFNQGFNWLTSKNQPYNLPITQVNSETVWPISPGSNHINQTSMALDSKGYPHIVFYANDKNDVLQYQHIWFNGTSWQHSWVSERTEGFKLVGGGALQLPISRPEILIDRDDTVYIIYRAEDTEQRLVANYITAPSYEFYSENTLILWDEPVGQAEPIIDRIRWQKEQVLTMLVQYNEQPNGDIDHKDIEKDILLIDLKFN